MNNIDMALKALMEFALAKNETDRETARDHLMAAYTCHTADRKDPEMLIYRVLMDIGAPDHLIGHPYVVRAAQMLIEEPALINSVVGLYESLAREFHTSPAEWSVLFDIWWRLHGPGRNGNNCTNTSVTSPTPIRASLSTASFWLVWPISCGCSSGAEKEVVHESFSCL